MLSVLNVLIRKSKDVYKSMKISSCGSIYPAEEHETSLTNNELHD